MDLRSLSPCSRKRCKVLHPIKADFRETWDGFEHCGWLLQKTHELTRSIQFAFLLFLPCRFLASCELVVVVGKSFENMASFIKGRSARKQKGKHI